MLLLESDRLSGIDDNVCILHSNTYYMFLGIDGKYETLSINLHQNPPKYADPDAKISGTLRS